jgi:hypothetical protein
VMEQDAKAPAGRVPQNSHCGLAKILGTANLGRGQAAVMVSLYARLSGAEGALLFGFSSAHRATDRQHLPQ